jgi:hypothetical protein
MHVDSPQNAGKDQKKLDILVRRPARVEQVDSVVG